MVLVRDGLTAPEADAFDLLEERLRASLDEEQVRLHEVRKTSLRHISGEDFSRTVPLYLEPLTYQGDEIVGAEPLRRV